MNETEIPVIELMCPEFYQDLSKDSQDTRQNFM
jgi:hypothetical protein